jgi:hypothetical protein
MSHRSCTVIVALTGSLVAAVLASSATVVNAQAGGWIRLFSQRIDALPCVTPANLAELEREAAAIQSAIEHGYSYNAEFRAEGARLNEAVNRALRKAHGKPRCPTDPVRRAQENFLGYAPRVSFGLNFGLGVAGDLPTHSTSGFFDGNTGVTTGMLAGGSMFVDAWTIGTGTAAFSSVTVSFGVVIDYISGMPLTYKGTGGGFPVIGNGTLDEFNVIGEVKFTTPVSPTITANIYFGAGSATLWPTGNPLGEHGPAFIGSDTAAAFRVGAGYDVRVADQWSVGGKIGFQFTSPTEFDTTLANERFRIRSKNEALLALGLTYRPAW